MKKVMIAGTSRTPIGIYDGKLKGFGEPALAVYAVKDVLQKTAVPGDRISEIVIGIAKQTSSPSNCARYIGLAADVPEEIPAYTVQRQGASGLQAVVNGFVKIRAGSADVIVAGGAESMSQIPYEIQNARYEFSPDKIVMDPISAMVAGGQPAAKYGRMTIQGINDKIAAAHGYTEEEQLHRAEASIAKATASTLDEEIIPIEIKVKKTVETVAADECYQKAEEVAGPADAAAMCVLLSEDAVQELGVTAEAELVAIGMSAGDPAGEGMVGAEAAAKALKKAGKTAADMDLIEINEITAAQTLAAVETLGLTPEEAEGKVNVYGGALATGNPWGASGVVELHRLLCGLRASGKTWGLVICGAEGGQALAAVIKMN